MAPKSRSSAAKKSFKLRGGVAMKNAQDELQNFKDDTSTGQALAYFSDVVLQRALPVFPALMAMSCKAIGGDAEEVTPFGESIVLISAAADLHDDVIDESDIKGVNQTVLGKFGAPTAILAGDILLAKGFEKLAEAAKTIPEMHSRAIISLVANAIFEICTAETIELKLRENTDLTPDEYMEVIRHKAVVPELTMKIGAIIGKGNPAEIKALGEFGRIYGLVSIIIEEFADLLDIKEMRNRLRSECPPLPLIYALQDIKTKEKLLSLISDSITEKALEKIIEIVLDSKEVQILQKIVVENINNGLELLPQKIVGKNREELENLMLAPLDCFKDC